MQLGIAMLKDVCQFALDNIILHTVALMTLESHLGLMAWCLQHWIGRKQLDARRRSLIATELAFVSWQFLQFAASLASSRAPLESKEGTVHSCIGAATLCPTGIRG